MKVCNKPWLVTMLSAGLIFSRASFADGLSHMTYAVNSPVHQSAVSETTVLEQRAGYWSLDITEYQRYLTLMEGPLGKWNANIDPLMALGMFAESAQESRRYAELYAQQEFAFTERVLHFQRDYHAAFKRLYPNARLFDQQLLAPYYTHQNQQSQARIAKRAMQQRFKVGDRLLVFVSRSCQGCVSNIQKLMGLLTGIPKTGVDVYVREAGNDHDVQAWAGSHGINPQWQEHQQLTLNRDEGLYKRLLALSPHSTAANFQVFLQRNQQFYAINREELGL